VLHSHVRPATHSLRKSTFSQLILNLVLPSFPTLYFRCAIMWSSKDCVLVCRNLTSTSQTEELREENESTSQTAGDLSCAQSAGQVVSVGALLAELQWVQAFRNCSELFLQNSSEYRHFGIVQSSSCRTPISTGISEVFRDVLTELREVLASRNCLELFLQNSNN
jgi:hypothetical protein